MAHVEYTLEEHAPHKNQLRTVLIAVLAVVVLVAGGTLAYLTTVTESVENVFTSGNIKAELIEAAWGPTDPPDGTSGSEIAENFLPGLVAPKDPLIKNTSDTAIGEWVGMMVTFQKPASVTDGVVDDWENMTEEEITAFFTGVRVQSGNAAMTSGGFAPQADWGSRIDTSANGVTPIPGQWVYAYATAVAQNGSSAALFDEVGILSTAGSEEWDGTLTDVSISNYMTWLHADIEDGGLGGHFQIVVQGAAIQEDVPEAERAGALLKLFGYTLTTP